MSTLHFQNVSQYKFLSFASLDTRTQQETVRNSRFNIPFGYRDINNQFHAFLNVDVDEHGSYVMVDHGNKIPLANIVAKKKQVPADKWMDHVVIVNPAGRTTPLKKWQIRVRRDYGTVSKSETE